MTTSVQDAEAEADLLSGKRSVSADVLHKLRDGWRHADLTAQHTRQAAEEERREAWLTGLAAIGAEVDKLAQPEHAEQRGTQPRAAGATAKGSAPAKKAKPGKK